jgi:proteasome accessory factor B
MSFLGVGVQQRVHTVSRKSERLVNLTIALLGTKRWLTKSQIFSSVDGYEGETDAKERMFERDKDDLRNLGIEIEVGSFDPLFEDEAGYRIRPDSYRADIEEISPRELSLISLATSMWQGAVLDSTALSALVKLKSFGIESDLDAIPAIEPQLHISDENLASIIDAIAARRTISFTYLAHDLTRQERVLEPYGAGTKGGYWYVAGRDLDRNDIRIFRLDRIDSKISVQGKNSSYEIPQSFEMATHLTSPAKSSLATLKIRRGKAGRITALSHKVAEDDEWLTVEYPFFHQSELLRDVLWHVDDVELIQPESARAALISSLQELVREHV